MRAFNNRDAEYDGVFFTAVRTTGIFCRPTCPARKPLAKNVEFFATAEQSAAAGYRPLSSLPSPRIGWTTPCRFAACARRASQ